MNNEPDEIGRTTEAALAALFEIIAEVRPSESARALLLSIAAVAAEVINDPWARQSFPWRMVRLAS
jgi:hypothetical protein